MIKPLWTQQAVKTLRLGGEVHYEAASGTRLCIVGGRPAAAHQIPRTLRGNRRTSIPPGIAITHAGLNENDTASNGWKSFQRPLNFCAYLKVAVSAACVWDTRFANRGPARELLRIARFDHDKWRAKMMPSLTCALLMNAQHHKERQPTMHCRERTWERRVVVPLLLNRLMRVS